MISAFQDVPPFDQATAEAFGGRMMDVLNGASLATMLSIGHQTGLFDTMAGLPPSTSAEVATATGLQERYVREWLGAMATGKIVDYDPVGATYHLPAEHAAALTRAAGADNVAFFTQYFALIGEIEQQVVRCFCEGGGVPYSAYPRFQKLQAEETARIFDAFLLDVALPLAPGLVERLEEGIDVLDIGCGSGHAINLMAGRFPNSRFTGHDFSSEGVAAGRAEASRLGLSNAHFAERNVSEFNQPGRYDLITAFDVVHDLAKPETVLRAVHAALRPGGIFFMQDIAASSDLADNLEHPLGPLLYTISATHCMTVSLAQGGPGLGTVWGRQLALQMLAEAGFTQVSVEDVPGDFMNHYYIAQV